MVCVFLSFMLGEERVLQEFGLSLSSAVFLDALVVRCMLLPALAHIVGRRTWLLPAWLDRLVPGVNIERSAVPVPAAAPEGGPTPVTPPATPRPRSLRPAGRAEG